MTEHSGGNQRRETPPACEFELEKLVIKLDEVVESDIRIIDEVVAKIVKLVEARHCWEDVENIDLALREALVNAIIHGNKSDPAKAARVCVALAEDCSTLIVVKDAGSGFDPNELPNPVMGENLLSVHGRGIFLINRLMDDVRFSFGQGTSIYMRRRAKN
jgi:serine/threonine-protein kinase RsbW